MPTNLLQIRRSTANATVTGLQPGELAFTQAGNTLFIGAPDGVSGSIRVGGQMVPGTLTANQALVANSTLGIDKVITANLVANSIWANGSSGTAGDILSSNGTAIYWKTPTPSVAGSDTQVQFNDGGSLAGDAGLTFNKTTDTLSAGKVAVVNTTASSNTTTGALTVAGGVGVSGRINVNDVAVGNDSVYATINNSVIGTNNLFATGTVNGSVISVGGWVIANNSGVFTSGAVNGDIIRVGTSVVANTTRLSLGTGIGFQVNGSVGSAGQILYSNGTSAYWDAVPAADITAVTAGSGLTGGGSSGDVTLDVGSGNGISVSADAIAVNGGSTLTVNTSGVHVNSTLSITSLTTSGDLSVNGNTKLGDATSDVASINARVNTAITPSANITYDLGENLLRWKNLYSSHVESTTGAFSGSLTVGGDLTVTGNLTTINVSSLSVTDPLIKLAVNNTTGDTLYIGFAGHYNGSGNTNNHTGLFREPTNKNYYLFSTYGDETKVNNNEIIVTDPSFTLANLNAYLLSGGLVTNATHVAITANSTVNVAITANTLTLSTALAGTSGGTGRSTSTNNALLVGNSTNGYNQLTLGTSGFVLQSNGTALVYDSIDGGTF